MKFSVVTISFNQARYLEQTIRSVIDQDYTDVEYIVLDPGSTDGSRDIIERYRDQIDWIVYEPDDGPADGLNKGFERATGEIFAFLNSDDFLLPGALSTIAAVFEGRRDRDVVSGNALVVDKMGREINRFVSRRFSLNRFVYGASALAQQSTFFRADAFRKVGGFNINNNVAWDGELWVDLALAGARFERIPQFISAFRLYDESISGSGKFYEAYARYLTKIFARVKGRTPDQRDRLLRWFYKGIEYISHPSVVKHRLLNGPVVRKSRA